MKKTINEEKERILQIIKGLNEQEQTEINELVSYDEIVSRNSHIDIETLKDEVAEEIKEALKSAHAKLRATNLRPFEVQIIMAECIRKATGKTSNPDNY